MIPRPNTLNESAEPVSSMRSARFFSNSLYKRSRKWREVTNLPSFPKNGESLFVNTIDMVGSSIVIGGNASGFSKSATVSPISNPSKPTIAQISPHWTSVLIFSLPSPSNVYSSLIFDFTIEPSRFTNETFCPPISVPRAIRPTAIRPMYEE